jgi:hypothetical protein
VSKRRKAQHYRPSPAAVAALDQLEARNAELFDRLRTGLPWHLVGGVSERCEASPRLKAWIMGLWTDPARTLWICPHTGQRELSWFAWHPALFTCAEFRPIVPLDPVEDFTCDWCRVHFPSGSTRSRCSGLAECSTALDDRRSRCRPW